MNQPSVVASGKRLEDVATELKEELRKACLPVIEILNRAASQGIVINYNLPRDQYGKFGPVNIDAVKPL